MKTKLFLSLAAVALATVSCTNDQVVESPATKAGNAISFSTYAQGTRASNDILNSNIKTNGNHFGVSAFLSEAHNSATAGTKVMNANVEIKSDGSNWDYVNAGDIAYWSGGKTKFFAYFPYQSSGITAATSLTSFASTVSVFSGIAIDGSTDVMVASTDELTSGVVTLPFKHVLSKIKEVSLKVTNSNMSVKVGGVTLCNSETTGTITLNADGSTTPVSASPAVPLSKTYGNASTDITSSSGKTTLFNDEANAYILPIASNIWDGTAGAASSNKAANAVCLKLTGVTVNLDNHTAYSGDIYIPIKITSLEAAKRYVFNIEFKNGIGCDADGNSIFSKITFDAIVVTDWADVTAVDITL